MDTNVQSSTHLNQLPKDTEPFHSVLERVQHAYDRDMGRMDDDLARRNQTIDSQKQRIIDLESQVAKLNKVLTEYEKKLSSEDAEKQAMLANKNALTEKYNKLRKGAAELENFRKTIVSMVQVGSAPPIIQADLEASFAIETTNPSDRNEPVRDVPYPRRLKQPNTQNLTDRSRKVTPAMDETKERPHDRDPMWSNDEDRSRGMTRSRGDEGRKHDGLEEFLRPTGESRDQMSETQQSLSMMTVLSDERDRGIGERSRTEMTGHESTVDYTMLGALSNADRTDFLDVINSTRSLEFPVPPNETSVRLQTSRPNEPLRVSSTHRNISARSSPSLSFTGRSSPSKHASRNDSSEQRISGKPTSHLSADVPKRPSSRASAVGDNGGQPRKSRESAFLTRPLARDNKAGNFNGESNYSIDELNIDSWTTGLKETQYEASPVGSDEWAQDMTTGNHPAATPLQRILLHQHPDEADPSQIFKPQRSRHQRSHSGASNVSTVSVSSTAVDAPTLYRRIRDELTTDQFAEFAKAIAAFNAATKTADETVKEVERLVKERSLFTQMKTLIYRALSDSATCGET